MLDTITTVYWFLSVEFWGDYLGRSLIIIEMYHFLALKFITVYSPNVAQRYNRVCRDQLKFITVYSSKCCTKDTTGYVETKI